MTVQIRKATADVRSRGGEVEAVIVTPHEMCRLKNELISLVTFVTPMPSKRFRTFKLRSNVKRKLNQEVELNVSQAAIVDGYYVYAIPEDYHPE